MIKAVIIDDELSAREVLENTIKSVDDDINVCGSGGTVEEAVAIINKQKPNIIFLDIELSYQSGFDLLDAIEAEKYIVIFTTAYNQYAIKAIRYAAFDYLLKPISPSELKSCLARAKETLTGENLSQKTRLGVLKEHLEGKSPQRLLIATDKGVEVLDKKKIVRLEGDRNYTIIHSQGNKPLLTAKTLKDYEEQLEGGDFFRVYQSHLINLNFVVRYLRGRGGKLELSDGTILPVSREKKQALLSILANK